MHCWNSDVPNVGPFSYILLNLSGLFSHKSNLKSLEYGDIDGISQTDVDTDILNYKEVRKLFTLPEKNEPNLLFSGDLQFKIPFKIPPIKNMNKGNLTMLLLKNNSRFSVEELEQYTYKPKFVIEN